MPKVLCAFAMTDGSAYLPSANKAIRDGCPDRLSVVATLFGLPAAPPETSRVLEIGCAEGVHLAALAVLAPGSRLLGVDLAARAVEKGNETISTLGLDNLKLECTDFRELARRSERYDYIVAHGVYSWVPREIRDALLSVVRDLLDERGVAYVSFNALPGSFARATDSLVHHDYLAEFNESVTVTAFVEHLDAHGLEYLADANTLDCSPFADQPLIAGFGRIERLAYVDGLEMRRFRQAIVCRKGASTGALDFSRAESFWFASSAEPAARGALRGPDPVRFKCVSGIELETTTPVIKTVLYELGRIWPAALRLDDLAERVGEHLATASNPKELARLLFDSGASAAVRAFARRPRAVHAPPQKPEATALARLEARRGVEVTNLHHEPVKVETPFHRELLTLVDGKRDRAALALALADAIESGSVPVPGIEPGARSRWEGLLGREVDAGLERLARYALLVA